MQEQHTLLLNAKFKKNAKRRNEGQSGEEKSSFVDQLRTFFGCFSCLSIFLDITSYRVVQCLKPRFHTEKSDAKKPRSFFKNT